MDAVLDPVINAGIKLSVDGDTLNTTSPEPLTDELRAYIRTHKFEIIAAITPSRSPGMPLNRAYKWRFLFCCPFTWRMLEVAAKRWGEPLDRDDLSDIAAGKYLFERKEAELRAYLQRWADDNPAKMNPLIDEFFPKSTRSRTYSSLTPRG